MSEIDLEKLLEPVSAADPAGEDLAYTPDVQALLDAAGGQPERVMGKTVIPAVQPDWKRALARGVALLSRSKDIRVAMLVCQALLQTKGLPGLSTGIALISGLLARYWDSIHPQLDPDDNNDPTERMNALLNLCDREAVLAPARMSPLARSRTFGTVSLRQIEIARGESSELADVQDAALDLATIDAAFLDSDVDWLREVAASVASAVANINAIETLFVERVGVSQAPDLDPIRDLLTSANTLLQAKVAERVDGDAVPSIPPNDGGSKPQEASGAAQSHPGNESTAITSREDVVRLLDKLCDYYARNEPSSPVPLLLQRARRLVTKDFMDIVKDLAPGALAQIEAIRGAQDENEGKS